MGNPNPNPNPMNSKQTNERKKNWTKKPTAAQTMCTVLNWYSHLSFTDFFVLFRCWCSLLLRSIKLSVSYGTQIHTIEWLCGGLLFLLPFSSSFSCCVWGVNTQIFNMDNRECVETTKTESTCLVGQRNTGDQENVKKRKRERTHTHAFFMNWRMYYSRTVNVLLVVGKPNNHPIFSFNTHNRAHTHYIHANHLVYRVPRLC